MFVWDRYTQCSFNADVINIMKFVIMLYTHDNSLYNRLVCRRMWYDKMLFVFLCIMKYTCIGVYLYTSCIVFVQTTKQIHPYLEVYPLSDILSGIHMRCVCKTIPTSISTQMPSYKLHSRRRVVSKSMIAGHYSVRGNDVDHPNEARSNPE